MDYFTKLDAPLNDLSWNIPEQKQGSINVVGGNSQNFKTSIKISEFLAAKYPVKDITVVLPDRLQTELPALPNFQFLPSTDSGSFATADSLTSVLAAADFNLLIGDFSKNAITRQALSAACASATTPTLITRDTVDFLASGDPATLLLNDQLIFLASVTQLQTLLRAMYYPKMLLLSQSLLQVAEVLHKFTLSYPASIITLHNGQILFAAHGQVQAVAIEKTHFSPITFWNGELAAKIAVFNLFSPHSFLEASVSAVFAG